MNNNNNNKHKQNRGNQSSPSICKVSRILRDLSESSFTPQLVSIGPIHRGDPNLKEFEGLKEGYRNDLLNRCEDSTSKKTLSDTCLLKVNTLITEIRKSYSDVVIKNYKDDELARMMVMDGCFILEFCLKQNKQKLLPNKLQNFRIAMDLILLENQVPFVVLQALFGCLSPHVGSVTLSQVLDTHLAPYIKLFREKNSTTDVDSDSTSHVLLSKGKDSEVGQHSAQRANTPGHVDSGSTSHVLLSKGKDSEVGEHSAQRANMPGHDDSDSTHAHVLGYLHKLYHLEAAKSSETKDAEASNLVDEEQAAKSSEPKHAEASKLVDEEQAAESWNRIMNDAAFLSIVELDRSGMNFKRHQEDEWSMTIKFEPSNFWSTPTLLMPTLVIDDTAELILRNFIAYEQSFPQDHYYFTSYANAMDKLIDSKEDIAKLVESKVLVNNLGSNQEAADMINKICKNIFFTDFYYTKVFKQMDEYYNGIWPNTIAWLRRVYFSNPWSAIALVAAIILFGLTVVQTIYTIRAA